MDKNRTSMTRQLALMFAFSVTLIWLVTTIVHYVRSISSVNSEVKENLSQTARSLDESIRQFPAHTWLVRYWYEHGDGMDIEYDVGFSEDTRTAQKCRTLAERHPDFQPEYADLQDVGKLPEEDRKLYAEIVYSWTITRMNRLADSYGLDYLFFVTSDAPYDRQEFLLISAEGTPPRGEGPGSLYPIGRRVDLSGKQQKALQQAVAGEPSTAPRSHYLDYYYAVDSFDGHQLLIGVTCDTSLVREAVLKHTVEQCVMSAIFLFILGILLLLMLQLSILRPLKIVQNGIRLYKNGHDSAAAIRALSDVRSRNEIGQLSDDVSSLATEMDDYIARIGKITSEKGRIEAELSLASRLQAAMLPQAFPRYPDRKDFEIFGSMQPARVVGGDLYDFLLVDDRHLCMYIADVSGKGIPAALFMTASKITLSHIIKEGRTPAQILTDLNESICANNPENMFVTVWLGILDLETGILTASNAGHEFPVLLQPGGVYEAVRDKHGLVVGGMDGAGYSEYELQLRPGSRLFLYTDGLAEATDAGNRMFGMDRILSALNKNTDASPEETLRNMQAAVSDFVRDAEQFDDLTMMCMVYHGRRPGN